MRVENIMSQATLTCRPTDTLTHAAKLMWDGDLGFLPAIQGGKVVGVITDRDICFGAATHEEPASRIPVADVMSRRHYTCLPEDDLKTALQLMATYRIRRLPVVDDAGKLRGVLSLNDVIQELKATGGVKDAPGPKDVLATLKSIGKHRNLPAASAP